MTSLPDIVECPHCHTQIVPLAAGTCPACRRNTEDRSGADPGKTKVSLSHGMALPPVCCGCGSATDRYVAVGATAGGGGGSPVFETLAFFAMLLVAPVSMALAAAARDESPGAGYRRQRNRLRVRLPQCPTCGTAGNPQPAAGDAETCRLDFVVDRRFAAALGTR